MRIIFALKKHPTVKDRVVKNRQLSKGIGQNCCEQKVSQACETPKCETCPLVFNLSDNVIVNGQKVFLDQSLNCKSKNIIYLAQCTICTERKTDVLNEDSYFGQTLTAAHTRFNGHRNKFKIDDKLSYTKSALSEHCFDRHRNDFKLSVFKIGFVTCCRAVDLDHEENRVISKFKTDIFGLNRMKSQVNS